MLACIYICCHVVGEKMREHEYDTDRNRAFDLLRIVCTFIIIIHHTEIFYGALNRGYIAVEFFFMSSGFFLYKSYRNHPEEGTIHYFVKRAKRLLHFADSNVRFCEAKRTRFRASELIYSF